jgi:phosphoserine phosphatase
VTLKALLFDLDNTLVPEMANYELAFAAACGETARSYSFDLVKLRAAVFGLSNEMWQQSDTFEYCASLGIGSPTSLLSDFPGDGAEFAELREWAPRYRERCWTDALRPLVKERVAVKLALDLDTAFRGALRIHCPPYDDAVPMLEELGHSYALAVLTNGPGDVQRIKLRASGLERYFAVTVASGDIGFGKPDPRVFTTALERLGVSANESIAIGDSFERDVVGARDAGLRCIWLNRDDVARPATKPDHEITSLNELAPLIVDLTSDRGTS